MKYNEVYTYEYALLTSTRRVIHEQQDKAGQYSYPHDYARIGYVIVNKI